MGPSTEGTEGRAGAGGGSEGTGVVGSTEGNSKRAKRCGIDGEAGPPVRGSVNGLTQRKLSYPIVFAALEVVYSGAEFVRGVGGMVVYTSIGYPMGVSDAQARPH